METIEGLLELPGALFRKFFTARKLSFDEILKDHLKNKLVGLCILILLSALALVIVLLR